MAHKIGAQSEKLGSFTLCFYHLALSLHKIGCYKEYYMQS